MNEDVKDRSAFVAEAERLVSGLGAPATAISALGGGDHFYHSFVLSDGTAIRGNKTLQGLEAEFDTNYGPVAIEGRSVLDVGAWNGAFSFEAKRRGARRVLSVDDFVWTHPVFRGLEKFLYVRKDKSLDVEYRVLDVPDTRLDTVGPFDVVMFLNVFYHLEDPLAALKQLTEVAQE